MDLRNALPRPDTSPPGSWSALGSYLAGGMLGWLVSPLLWLPSLFSLGVLGVGPLRWLCMLAATASQESAFSTERVGDDGTSIGIAQFNNANRIVRSTALSGNDWRTSAFWSGWYTARYAHLALVTSPYWWLIHAPFLGYFTLRALWLRGAGRGKAALGLVKGDLNPDQTPRPNVWNLMTSEWESRGRVTFFTWRAVSMGPVLIWWGLIARAVMGRRR